MSTPLKSEMEAVVIGTSAGGIDALKKLLPMFPANYPLPIIIVLHLSPNQSSILAEIFKDKVNLNVKEADEKESIKAGTIYFAPAGYHLLIEKDKTFSLSTEEPVNYSRPSIDVLFETAADSYGPNLIAILLTGANKDGSLGLKSIKESGGIRIVQDDAVISIMPNSGLPFVSTNCSLSLADIGTYLLSLY